jgi:hypothetical protein
MLMDDARAQLDARQRIHEATLDLASDKTVSLNRKAELCSRLANQNSEIGELADD